MNHNPDNINIFSNVLRSPLKLLGLVAITILIFAGIVTGWTYTTPPLFDCVANGTCYFGNYKSNETTTINEFLQGDGSNVTNVNADTVDGYHLNQGVRTTDSPTFVNITGNVSGQNVSAKKIGEVRYANQYTTLQDAINATPYNGNLIQVGDITLPSHVNISRPVNIDIYGNVTVTSGDFVRIDASNPLTGSIKIHGSVIGDNETTSSVVNQSSGSGWTFEFPRVEDFGKLWRWSPTTQSPERWYGGNIMTANARVRENIWYIPAEPTGAYIEGNRLILGATAHTWDNLSEPIRFDGGALNVVEGFAHTYSTYNTPEINDSASRGRNLFIIHYLSQPNNISLHSTSTVYGPYTTRLGDVTVQTSFNYTGTKGIVSRGQIQVNNSSPIFELNESDQTGADGLWRIVASAGGFRIDKNTAANRDYSTSVQPITVTANGNITLQGTNPPSCITMESPNGTAYKFQLANGGTTNIEAGTCS